MRTQNKPRHQSAVTREDFCCGFWVIFGWRLVFVLVLSMGTGATDADGSAVATVGVSSDMLLIGHGVASLMRLAIVPRKVSQSHRPQAQQEICGKLKERLSIKPDRTFKRLSRCLKGNCPLPKGSANNERSIFCQAMNLLIPNSSAGQYETCTPASVRAKWRS
jgi:hypothetical protein